MPSELNIERSKAAQQAQTVKVKPRWHMTVLHVVYYLIMVAFLVFYMLPFWGTVMTSFKTNSEVMTTTPITPPSQWTLEGYASAMEELGQPLGISLMITLFGAAGSVFLGSVCAYALSKWKFRLNNVFFIEFPSFLCQVLLLYIRRTSRRYCVGTMSNRYQICNKRVFFGVRTRGREKNMLYWNT